MDIRLLCVCDLETSTARSSRPEMGCCARGRLQLFIFALYSLHVASNGNECQEYFLGGRGDQGRAANLTTFMCRLSWNPGASASWQPQGLSSVHRDCFACFYRHFRKKIFVWAPIQFAQWHTSGLRQSVKTWFIPVDLNVGYMDPRGQHEISKGPPITMAPLLNAET